MPRVKLKKNGKSEKGRVKENIVDKNGDGKDGEEGRKEKEIEGGWSDWFWDEELKVYYRAKLGNGDEWTYDYACPNVHPATKNETASFVPENVVYPKVEEKVIFVLPGYKFEVPGEKGKEYFVVVSEEMKAAVLVPGVIGKAVEKEGDDKGNKTAVKTDGKGGSGGGE